MNEYIIVNKTTILKRIEELEDIRRYGSSDSNDYYQGQIKALGDFLSQSTPLTSEIEKAFDAGKNSHWQVQSQDYISNLKLDI
jgi:hypothetical protein